MNISVEVRQSAERDVLNAKRWYNQQRAGLGEELVDDLSATLQAIAIRGESFPTIWKRVRRARLDRFPYHVLFRIERHNAIVFAVTHERRDPKSWQRRA